MKIRSLTRQKDFQTVYRQGRKFVGRTHVLYLLPADDDAKAVVASKKVGNAVRRNRAKRLLRELLQAVVFEGPERSARITACLASGTGDAQSERTVERPGLWAVAVARRAILDCDVHAVKAESLAMLDDASRDRGPDADAREGTDRSA